MTSVTFRGERKVFEAHVAFVKKVPSLFISFPHTLFLSPHTHTHTHTQFSFSFTAIYLIDKPATVRT